MIYLLTVNYQSAELVKRLIQSLPQPENVAYQVVIVNNSAEIDGNAIAALTTITQTPLTVLNTEENIGFGKGCNLGLNWIYQQNKNAIVWLINPDTTLPPNTLEKVPIFFQKYPEISILGTQIKVAKTQENWFVGGKFIPQRGAVLEVDLIAENPDADYIESDWISGCSLIISLQNFSKCPTFDPAYFLYYEDFDFCYRYRQQNHKIAIAPQISVIHYPSSITNRYPDQKLKHSTFSYLLMLRKYAPFSVFILRFLRVLVYGIILLPIKPKVGMGKLTGIINFLSPR